ncbi:MAG: enoyl-CoA hydratase/isomerase family protein [Acidobacteria bacterium]|nr:enoyl-CoA hydratase/isomerase family protein [Acidobacteriota bacterium]
MRLDRDGAVFVLQLDDTENRFDPAWVAEFVALLDEVESAVAPRALVTTGVGRYWSNGLSLDWITAHPVETPTLIGAVHELLARLLESPVPTVAAISGHAYAAGAMLAMAHDHRMMREDRGYFCFPEIDIRLPFSVGMTALLTAKLAPPVVRDAMLFGRRYDSGSALDAGLVDDTASLGALLEESVRVAAGLAGKDPGVLGTIKRRTYAGALAALRAGGEDLRLTLPTD